MKLVLATFLATVTVCYFATPKGVIALPVEVAVFGQHTVTLPVSPVEYAQLVLSYR